MSSTWRTYQSGGSKSKSKMPCHTWRNLWTAAKDSIWSFQIARVYVLTKIKRSLLEAIHNYPPRLHPSSPSRVTELLNGTYDLFKCVLSTIKWPLIFIALTVFVHYCKVPSRWYRHRGWPSIYEMWSTLQRRIQKYGTTTLRRRRIQTARWTTTPTDSRRWWVLEGCDSSFVFQKEKRKNDSKLWQVLSNMNFSWWFSFSLSSVMFIVNSKSLFLKKYVFML